MERAVVSFVVGRLGDMLIQEGKFLAGVRDQVQQLWLELKRMQCFLEEISTILIKKNIKTLKYEQFC